MKVRRHSPVDARHSEGVDELRIALEQLLERRDLEPERTESTFAALTNADVPLSLKGAVLATLSAKGETPRELAGFVRAMLARATGAGRDRVRANRVLVDTCGTGGDGSNAFNLSTAAALLVAALGVPVAKHGNRSVSSRTGSADLIEALGIPFSRSIGSAGRDLRAFGFAFLFAPDFHPAMKELACVRGELGVRTLFNVLGPLVNPLRPTHQLTGTGDVATGRRMAATLAELGGVRASVVCGALGWDEATPIGTFTSIDVERGQVTERRIDPRDYGVATCVADDLVGGDAATNARLLRDVFSGRPGPMRDAVVLNAALVLQLIGRERRASVAAAHVARGLDDGRANVLLARLCGRRNEA